VDSSGCKSPFPVLKNTKSIEEGKVASGYQSPEIQILEGRQIQVWFRDGSGDERGRRAGRAVAAFRMSQLPLFERLDGIRPGVTGPRR